MATNARRKTRGASRRARAAGAVAVVASATAVKNAFGRYLETAVKGGRVVIEKHAAPKAVLLSIEEFDSLTRARQVRLAELAGRFDALLDRMQGPQARRAAQNAFDISPKDLARAAVTAIPK